MTSSYSDFAQTVVDDACYGHFEKQKNTRITIPRSDAEWAVLDLTPFAADAQDCTAWEYFKNVANFTDLVQAYQQIRIDYEFESDVSDAMAHVSDYAEIYLQGIFTQAERFIDATQVKLIADWVAHLDVYTAVKAIESLLNSKADLTLLKIAAANNWDVLFDHLAIRCGSQDNHDAERVVDLLKSQHGYVSSQLPREAFYQFPEGWNAYPLYKILKNGQVLRVFVDQSASDRPGQIIQHWNRVYGYTAHHLAIRATSYQDGRRVAVPLEDITSALEKQGVHSMTPTGRYTAGLLVQAFTKPEKDKNIPRLLKQQIESAATGLATIVENAKLLEIVSRREMPSEHAQQFFDLYGITYDANNALHSAPVYQYFLPAQAAHVIKTSIQA